MTTKEEQFKTRFASVLADLHQDGVEDGEAMFLLGAGATRICDMGQKASWTELKQALSHADYDRLIEQCRTEGNSYAAEGKQKAAYAIQALAMSLVARTQTDPVIREGERLLDAVIDKTVANYRQHAQSPNRAN